MFFKVINAPRGLLYLISSQLFSDLVSSSRPISAHLMFFHVFSPLLSSSQPVSALPCSSPLLISSQLISSLLSSCSAHCSSSHPFSSQISSSQLIASLRIPSPLLLLLSPLPLSPSQLFSAFLVQHLFQTRSRCQSPKNKVGPRTQKQDGTQHTFF